MSNPPDDIIDSFDDLCNNKQVRTFAIDTKVYKEKTDEGKTKAISVKTSNFMGFLQRDSFYHFSENNEDERLENAINKIID